MEVIRSAAAMTAWSNRQLAQGRSIGLVPTMGCLHAGHLSLIRLAAAHADLVVTSLFVNPMQVGPHEDFAKYPQTFDRDAELAQAAGVAVLFAPSAEELYPPGFQTQVTVEELSQGLCGASRPGHFAGVVTVVGKLFNIVKPKVAVFGEKDWQQLAVIRRLVRDLNWDIAILAHPIVREADGLAMSSRNRYLSPEERRTALVLNQAIALGRSFVAGGHLQTAEVVAELQRFFAQEPGVAVEYIVVVGKDDLRERKWVTEDALLALAAWVGSTRLIDNGLLGVSARPGETSALEAGLIIRLTR